MSIIACLYIDCKSSDDRNNLESLLYSNGYAFYDATNFDSILIKNTTLESIEAEYELK